MGVAATDSLHIGDSLEDDYHGASRVGIKPVFLDRHRKYASPPAPLPVGEGSKRLSFPPPPGEGGPPRFGVVGEASIHYNDLVVIHTLADLPNLLNA